MLLLLLFTTGGFDECILTGLRSVAIEAGTGAAVGALSGGISSTSSMGARLLCEVELLQCRVVGQLYMEFSGGQIARNVLMSVGASVAIQGVFAFLDFSASRNDRIRLDGGSGSRISSFTQQLGDDIMIGLAAWGRSFCRQLTNQ